MDFTMTAKISGVQKRFRALVTVVRPGPSVRVHVLYFFRFRRVTITSNIALELLILIRS